MSNEALVGVADNNVVPVLTPMEVMQNLDDKQRARYVAFQEVFDTDGWKQIEEWAELKALEAEKAGMNADFEPEWRRAQGARIAWNEVSRLAEMFLNQFENVALQNKIDAEEALDIEMDD